LKLKKGKPNRPRESAFKCSLTLAQTHRLVLFDRYSETVFSTQLTMETSQDPPHLVHLTRSISTSEDFIAVFTSSSRTKEFIIDKYVSDDTLALGLRYRLKCHVAEMVTRYDENEEPDDNTFIRVLLAVSREFIRHDPNGWSDFVNELDSLADNLKENLLEFPDNVEDPTENGEPEIAQATVARVDLPLAVAVEDTDEQERLREFQLSMEREKTQQVVATTKAQVDVEKEKTAQVKHREEGVTNRFGIEYHEKGLTEREKEKGLTEREKTLTEREKEKALTEREKEKALTEREKEKTKQVQLESGVKLVELKLKAKQMGVYDELFPSAEPEEETLTVVGAGVSFEGWESPKKPSVALPTSTKGEKRELSTPVTSKRPAKKACRMATPAVAGAVAPTALNQNRGFATPSTERRPKRVCIKDTPAYVGRHVEPKTPSMQRKISTSKPAPTPKSTTKLGKWTTVGRFTTTVNKHPCAEDVAVCTKGKCHLGHPNSFKRAGSGGGKTKEFSASVYFKCDCSDNTRVRFVLPNDADGNPTTTKVGDEWFVQTNDAYCYHIKDGKRFGKPIDVKKKFSI
jgi:hypothetical protein